MSINIFNEIKKELESQGVFLSMGEIESEIDIINANDLMPGIDECSVGTGKEKEIAYLKMSRVGQFFKMDRKQRKAFFSALKYARFEFFFQRARKKSTDSEITGYSEAYINKCLDNHWENQEVEVL